VQTLLEEEYSAKHNKGSQTLALSNGFSLHDKVFTVKVSILQV
jgi:hypothetical protein